MKYVIGHELPNNIDASVKAHVDIDRFVKELGYKSLTFSTRHGKSGITRELNRLVSIWHIARIIKNDDTVLVHYPVYSSKIDIDYFYNKVVCKAHNKICVIHDLPFLRDNMPPKNEILRNEIRRLNIFDQVIVHNDSMKDKLISLGLTSNVIVLGIFDYYAEKETSNDQKINTIPTKVIFAGNLEKSSFVTKVKSSHYLQYNFWGNIRDKNLLDDSVVYHGVVSSDELPSFLHNGWGLVWDGTSTDDIGGLGGNYLRYIDPHKTSLYLVSGIPVIVWKNAGIAKFILDNNLGFAVSSLNEIDNRLKSMTKDDYVGIKQSVYSISADLRKGKMIKTAVTIAEHKLHI